MRWARLLRLVWRDGFRRLFFLLLLTERRVPAAAVVAAVKPTFGLQQRKYDETL
jgi:hypothetical protein